MKNSIKTLSIILITGFLLSINSCDKVKDIVPIPSMTATVDGTSWFSIFRLSVLFTSNNMISITGTPEASEEVDKAIILSIYGTAPGIYRLDPGTLTAQCLVIYKLKAGATNGSADYYISRTATIVITELDTEKKRISGTFTATLNPSNDIGGAEMSITNGKFENLNYQVEP